VNADPAVELEVVETRTLRLWMCANGFLRGVAKRGQNQSYLDAKANIAAASTLTRGTPRPFLLDIRNAGTLSRAARQHYSSEQGAAVAAAIGFLTDSPFSRIAGNIFIRTGRGHFPLRLFTSEATALEWLREYLP